MTLPSKRMQSPTGATPELTIVVHDVGPIGGMERQLTELISGFVRAGLTPTLISRSFDHPDREKVNWIRIRTPSRPFSIAYPLFAIAAGIAVRRHGRGVIHSNGALIFNRVDIATIHFCHIGFHRSGALKTGARDTVLYRLNAAVADAMSRLGERIAYRSPRVRTLIGISQGVSDEAVAAYGFPATRVVTIPYGVDIDTFQRDEAARRECRASLGVADDELLSLFVGGDWDRKGLRFAIEALVNAPRWTLAVVGGGDEQRYQAIADALGVRGRVQFLGRRTLPTDLYSAADAFCLPTSYETFCLVAHEAAAAGLPLLVTRVHGVDVLLEDEVNGWFITRDARDISARLNLLADDGDRRRAMGQAAREASTSYSWQSAVEAHLDLYRAVAAASTAPSSTPPGSRSVNTLGS